MQAVNSLISPTDTTKPSESSTSELAKVFIERITFLKDERDFPHAFALLREIQLLPDSNKDKCLAKISVYFGSMLYKTTDRQKLITEFNENKLTTLSVINDKNDQEYIKWLSHITSLTTLKVFNKLTDNDLKHIPKTVTDLTLLDCSNLTAKGLDDLPKHIKNLFLVALNNISLILLPCFINNLTILAAKISDDNLHLPAGLEKLTLTNCSELTDASLSRLPSGLEELTLYCDQISNAAKENLRKKGVKVIG